MRVKYAKDIIKEIQARGSIQVPEGYITGEAFEEWLEGKERFGMSISEQVKELREIASEFDLDGKEELSNMINEAADTIEALSAKLSAANRERSDRYYGGGWILCSERFPNVNDNVLICFDFKGRRSVELGCFWSDGSPHCDSDEYLTPTGRKERKAVAWMELPKLYKGQP